MKTVTKADRARRRQKSTKSISSMSTASAPRIARGRNQKSDKDVKGNGGSNQILNKPVNGVNDVNTLRNKTGAVGHRFKGKKRSRANEIANETKDKGDRELSSVKSVKKQECSEKVDVNIKKEDPKSQDVKNDTVGEGSKNDTDGKTKENKEGVESMFPLVKNDRFDFRDGRIDSLSDFDKSDNEDEFESASDSNFTPQNGTVQMTEQGSSEIVSSASWISENYDF